MSNNPLTVKRSFSGGRVGIGVRLQSRGWPGDSVTVAGSVDISTATAREIAALLIAAADAEDAKIAKKNAADARRKAWRDREVAAGRLVVMSAREFFKTPTGAQT